MDTFIESYIDWLEKLHEEFKKTLADLPPEGLDWSPGEGTNSLAVLGVHISGAERYWIGDVVMGNHSERDRQAEFQTVGLASLALARHLDASLAYIRKNLASLRPEDLDTERTIPRDQRRVTCIWALLHALEHTAGHVGHAQLTRQWWDLTHPK